MSLIVSVRIPNYVIIAADSSFTLMEFHGKKYDNIEAVCPNCNDKHNVKHEYNIPSRIAHNFTNVDKIMPFLEKFAIGVWNSGIINNISAHHSIKIVEQNIEKILKNQPEIKKYDIEYIANLIQEEFYKLFNKDNDNYNKLIQDYPHIINLHLVGCTELIPQAAEINISKDPADIIIHKSFGCTISGENKLIKSMWDMDVNHINESGIDITPAYNIFSLVDGIEYAEFLIKYTMEYQKFSKYIPNVGGDIRIAYISKYDGFQWR